MTNNKLLIADKNGIRIVKPFFFFWYKVIKRFDNIDEALKFLNEWEQ